MSVCTVCRRTAPDGQRACPICADQVRAWLAELPHQALLLQEFLAPGAQPAEGRIGGTGRAHAPSPVDLRVLVLLGPGHAHPPGRPEDDTDDTVPITVFLAGWAGHIAYTYPAAYRDRHGTAHTQPCDQAWPADGTIAGWCTWLTAYLPYALTLPHVDELHRQLGTLIHRVRDLTHAEPRNHPQAAPCPRCDAFALVRTDGHWHIRCTACGHRLDPETYDQHAAQFLQTAQEGADYAA
ncbi:hypothetical protein [Streptomyces soliscabiei]|uniref:hypothetical protein n=1 Tax=Streptomyces soliscabiei TaxID=588897 RepID=UPI0029AE1F43|nr:hypothetical protein [Streptomyces sp. NY05-11A]MDX2681087.1 hypothetical protein [Streptomyces sp. NY05-11A]